MDQQRIRPVGDFSIAADQCLDQGTETVHVTPLRRTLASFP